MAKITKTNIKTFYKLPIKLHYGHCDFACLLIKEHLKINLPLINNISFYHI